VKVEVLSSDLIIYAAGCRGLPLRFTALRKQEQIERSRWNEPVARPGRTVSRIVSLRDSSFRSLSRYTAVWHRETDHRSS
jgi:hypothetical protein